MGALTEFRAGQPAGQEDIHAVDPDIAPLVRMDNVRLAARGTVGGHPSIGRTLHPERREREIRGLRLDARERRQDQFLADEFAVFDLPAEFHGDWRSRTRISTRGVRAESTSADWPKFCGSACKM